VIISTHSPHLTSNDRDGETRNFVRLSIKRGTNYYPFKGAQTRNVSLAQVCAGDFTVYTEWRYIKGVAMYSLSIFFGGEEELDIYPSQLHTLGGEHY
jgi:hypothetical protein